MDQFYSFKGNFHITPYSLGLVQIIPYNFKVNKLNIEILKGKILNFDSKVYFRLQLEKWYVYNFVDVASLLQL